MGLTDFLRKQAAQIFELARRCKFPEVRTELEDLALDLLAEADAIESDDVAPRTRERMH